MFTGRFWKETAERALKSAGQGGAFYLGTIALQGATGDAVNLLAVDWRLFLGFVSGFAVLSVVTSVASAPVGASDSPSIVGGGPAQGGHVPQGGRHRDE